jgi:hypothetical protein
MRASEVTRFRRERRLELEDASRGRRSLTTERTSWSARIVRNDAQQGVFIATVRVDEARGRKGRLGVRRQQAEETANQLQGMRVGIGDQVGQTVAVGLDVDAAERVLVGLLAGGSDHQRRTGDSHRRRAADHDHQIAERGEVEGPANPGPMMAATVGTHPTGSTRSGSSASPRRSGGCRGLPGSGVRRHRAAGPADNRARGSGWRCARPCARRCGRSILRGR